MSGASYTERVVNIDSDSTTTSTQEGTPPLNYSSNKPEANSITREDIILPRFNGNGAEYQQQHWFLCEVVWMVHQLHSAIVRKVQMITTLRGCALDQFTNFCVVPLGTPQNTLDGIPPTMICEFRKPRSESECITEIKEIKKLPT